MNQTGGLALEWDQNRDRNKVVDWRVVVDYFDTDDQKGNEVADEPTDVANRD